LHSGHAISSLSDLINLREFIIPQAFLLGYQLKCLFLFNFLIKIHYHIVLGTLFTIIIFLFLPQSCQLIIGHLFQPTEHDYYFNASLDPLIIHQTVHFHTGHVISFFWDLIKLLEFINPQALLLG